MAVVVIDPGHGGSNVGASDNGIIEKHLTLKLGWLLYMALKDSAWGVKPKLTRTEDETMGLAERANLAGEWGAVVACTIHVNAAPFAADGVRAYHLNGDKIGRQMAQAFSNTAPLQLKDKNAVQVCDSERTKNVLKYYQCSAVLFEVGFCSSKKDAQVLTDPRGQLYLASAMANGVKVGVDAWAGK